MKIKNLLFFIFLFTGSLSGRSQTVPVTWSAGARKVSGNSYIITVTATIPAGWYIYATNDSASGLSDTEISFDAENINTLSGTHLSSDIRSIHDPAFDKVLKVYKNSCVMNETILFNKIVPASLKLKIHAFASNGKELQTVEETREVKLEGGITANPNLSDEIRLSAVDLNHPISACGSSEKKKSGILGLFFLGMAGGLIALLTPCVFPMIPVTVSFFTNRAKNKSEGIKNGLIYGASIFMIYLLASLPFHLIGDMDPEILNRVSTNAWVNIIFFFVFIFFALSFFGLFEITLPSNLVNKTDSKSSLGSFTGIFFMALTLAAVSFSCTGPILGSLLVGSLTASAGAWQLTAGMAGFGLALALPFGLFARFPDWLKKIPKSGWWLDTVKIILAFIELALAFKFLSNADLVEHWGILKREVFIGIWILISLSLFIYLALHRLVILSFLTIVFTIYLILGFSGISDLRFLSGFTPPGSCSIHAEKKGLKPNYVNDYAGALLQSRIERKPILIDFTGWACVNCRKMEEQVLNKPEISEIIRKKFILVSLYVDDRKKIPKNFSYKTKSGAEKEIETMGDKWATFESENFNQVTQPLYVILNPGEQLMNEPVGYTADPAKYKRWLECGIGADKD